MLALSGQGRPRGVVHARAQCPTLDVGRVPRHSCAMRKSMLAIAAACLLAIQPVILAGQTGAEPGDPLRIAIFVDNSHSLTDPLIFIRRGLQQFLNALPPNHELMLVATGGQMNIRVEPTRDYLKVVQSANTIAIMRSSGNAMFGSVEEVYDRFFRGLERRYPMFVIIASDGPDLSQQMTNERAAALFSGLKKSGVMVNAVLINPSGWTGVSRSHQIASFTQELVDRSGGALEWASAPTVPAKLKNLAARIAQQYKEMSPGKEPVPEFRK
jgi:hypothetical protein